MYIVLPIDAFSLGYVGLPATSQYGSGYWTLIVNALLKLVIIVFTICFAIDVTGQWATVVANATFTIPPAPQPNPDGTYPAQMVNVGALKLSISIALASFILLFIVKTLPSLFLGLLTGNPGSADSSIESQTQAVGSGGGTRDGGPGGSPVRGKTPQSTGNVGVPGYRSGRY